MQSSKPKSGLNEIQHKAVHHPDGPVLIAAGAGSGKTKTLTSRVIHLLESGIPPEQIIAITFTNKAAKEMRSRIAATLEKKQLTINKKKSSGQMSNVNGQMSTNGDMPFVGTFHALGASILRQEAQLAQRTGQFTIFDADDSYALIKSVHKSLNLSGDRFNPYAIAMKISSIKNELEDIDEYRNGSSFDKVLVSIYEKYEAALKQSNAFDFDDLIEKTVRIFQQHPGILEKYQKQWQHILVDEFQDVNTNQYLFLKLLAAKHHNLFVIGDDAQSIYAFRGSDFRNFLNFEKDWDNATVISLEENYRSTQNIIRAASRLISHNKFQKKKELWTKNPEGGLIDVFAVQDAEEEARTIAEKIHMAIADGEPMSEIAILYRTNAQSRALEQALIRFNISYEIFGGLKFYARKEIKDIVACLRYAANPDDIAAIERINKTFLKKDRERLLGVLPSIGKELPLVELINFILNESNYIEFIAGREKKLDERVENIKELIQYASGFKSTQNFLEQVTLMSAIDGRPKLQENAVKLMTIHLAKGLEFNRIFIAGANEGLLPHERSMAKSEELEEERRLMYVAMTRARKLLTISFYNLPSRFLGELPPELIEFKKITPRGEENRDWDDDTIYLE